MRKVLVTGGAGYIGSHVLIELIAAGYDVVVIDNLSNSSIESVKRVEKLTKSRVKFYQNDIRNRDALRQIFSENNISAIIHFAGLKAVGESVAKPLEYYDNNVGGSTILFQEARFAGCNIIVFSSSATVYGDPQKVPIKESAPAGITTNPYGRSKWMIEKILHDALAAYPEWKIALLRYFNPVGAHESGLIGENPTSIPNNLMPYVSQVAVGKLEKLQIFGGDYPTRDGTGIRDYIHVVDLAKGHIKALSYLLLRESGEVLTVNLGTGKGTSVLEMVKSFEKACGKKIAYEITDRRAGDIAICFADPELARQKLLWQAEKTVDDMCIDTWNWQSKNPGGFLADRYGK